MLGGLQEGATVPVWSAGGSPHLPWAPHPAWTGGYVDLQEVSFGSLEAPLWARSRLAAVGCCSLG